MLRCSKCHHEWDDHYVSGYGTVLCNATSNANHVTGCQCETQLENEEVARG